MTRFIEVALNKFVNATEQSGNIRKELKKTIYGTVSTLRKLFVTLKVQLEEGKSENERLESELRDTKVILKERKQVSNKADTEWRLRTLATEGGKAQHQSADKCCRRTNIHRNKTVSSTQI